MDQDSNRVEDEFAFSDMPEFSHLPPMDPWRRIKREVIKFINMTRNEEAETESEVFTDHLLSVPALEYAAFILEDMEDDTKLREILKKHGLPDDMSCAAAVTLMEEDQTDINLLVEDFQDAHGLLMETDRNIVLSTDLNHVGLGLAAQDMRIALVEIYISRAVAILSISDGEDGGVDIRGKMLKTEVGLYAVRVVNRLN
jgi:hypothetical protein